MAGRQGYPAVNETDATTTVGIPVERYNELLYAEHTLGAMYAAGVDNWEGMDEVMNILNDEGV